MPGGVDQIEVEAELVVTVVDGIARGASDVGHDVPLLADKGIDQRRLAGVGTPHDGELGNVLLRLLVIFLFGHVAHYLVQQVARAAAVGRRHLDRIAQAETVEFRHVVARFGLVLLVGHDDHRFLRPAKHGRYLVVEIGHSRRTVNHEQDHIGLFDGYVYLLVDFLLEHVVRVHDPTAGVDYRKFLAAPVNLAVLTVAGRARCVVDDGLTRLRQTVEQCRLADVRPAYYRYQLAHLSKYPNSRNLLSRLRQSFSTLTKSSR